MKSHLLGNWTTLCHSNYKWLWVVRSTSCARD